MGDKVLSFLLGLVLGAAICGGGAYLFLVQPLEEHTRTLSAEINSLQTLDSKQKEQIKTSKELLELAASDLQALNKITPAPIPTTDSKSTNADEIADIKARMQAAEAKLQAAENRLKHRYLTQATEAVSQALKTLRR